MRKLFKKSIACCLALALCFTLFAGAISVNALTTTPTFSTAVVEAVQGEDATIKFTVTDFAEIQGVMLKFYVPAVVSAINSVASEDIELVEWDDENGTGNYEIGADETGKFVKFMELANFTGVDTVEGFTFKVNVTVAADAALGAAEYPVAYIAGTDGEAVYDFECNYADFTVVAPVVKPEPPASTGSVAYGTFENVPSDNQEFFGWFNSNSGCSPSITTVDSYTGAKSLRVVKEGENKQKSSVCYVNINPTLEVGKAYELTAYVKVKGVESVDELGDFWVGQLVVEMQTSRFGSMVKINGSDVSQNNLWKSNEDASEWTKITIPIADFDKEITSMRFMFRYAEEFWMDDVSIVEVELPEEPAFEWTEVSYDFSQDKLSIGRAAMSDALKAKFAEGKGPDAANADTRKVEVVAKIGESEFPFETSIKTGAGSIFVQGFALSHMTANVKVFVRVTNPAIDFVWESNAYEIVLADYLTEQYTSGADTSAELAAWVNMYNQYTAAKETITLTNYSVEEGLFDFTGAEYSTESSRLTLSRAAMSDELKAKFAEGKGPDGANADTRKVEVVAKVGESEFPFETTIKTGAGSIYVEGFALSHFNADVEVFVRVTNPAIDFAWESNAVSLKLDTALSAVEGSAFVDAYNAYKAVING